MYISDKQAEDQPTSPWAAATVDLVPLETSQQKAIVESAGVAQGILGCHSALVVSAFLNSGTFVELSSTFVDHVLLAGSGQTSRRASRVLSAGWGGYPADG